jgi:hypothetical protein
MIKKVTPIVFILLANILLLTHAVLPHHHHNKQVCLIKSHCINDNNSKGHSSDNESHNHDDENNSNDCVLKELIAISSNDWKQEFKFTASAHYQQDHASFHYDLLNIGEEAVTAILLQSVSVHKVKYSYTYYVSASLGLRAPPII